MHRCVWIILLGAMAVSARAEQAVSPDATDPNELRIADSVSPSVQITHQGRLLILTYRPPESDGRQPSDADPRPQPPAFTIYKGQRKIASGRFEYG